MARFSSSLNLRRAKLLFARQVGLFCRACQPSIGRRALVISLSAITKLRAVRSDADAFASRSRRSPSSNRSRHRVKLCDDRCMRFGIFLRAHPAPFHRLDVHRPERLDGALRLSVDRSNDAFYSAFCSRNNSLSARSFSALRSTFSQRMNVSSQSRCSRQYLRRERPLLRHASTWIDHQALSALFP